MFIKSQLLISCLVIVQAEVTSLAIYGYQTTSAIHNIIIIITKIYDCIIICNIKGNICSMVPSHTNFKALMLRYHVANM